MFPKLITLLTLLITTQTFAASDPACEDDLLATRPYASTLPEAAGTFASIAQYQITLCAVKELIEISKLQNIRITGFMSPNLDQSEIFYNLLTFKDSGVGLKREQKCVVRLSYVHGQGQVAAPPECTDVKLEPKQ